MHLVKCIIIFRKKKNTSRLCSITFLFS